MSTRRHPAGAGNLLTLYPLTTRVTVHLHDMENRLDSATKLIVDRSTSKTLVTSFSLTLGIGVRTVLASGRSRWSGFSNSSFQKSDFAIAVEWGQPPSLARSTAF